MKRKHTWDPDLRLMGLPRRSFAWNLTARTSYNNIPITIPEGKRRGKDIKLIGTGDHYVHVGTRTRRRTIDACVSAFILISFQRSDSCFTRPIALYKFPPKIVNYGEILQTWFLAQLAFI